MRIEVEVFQKIPFRPVFTLALLQVSQNGINFLKGKVAIIYFRVNQNNLLNIVNFQLMP